jgi:hypothetical protein
MENGSTPTARAISLHFKRPHVGILSHAVAVMITNNTLQPKSTSLLPRPSRNEYFDRCCDGKTPIKAARARPVLAAAGSARTAASLPQDRAKIEGPGLLQEAQIP